ncbi:MAG TPA: pirin family protein [Actinomycetota bacterium]|nr:pirin family protein [Actinomycetota bacterium]
MIRVRRDDEIFRAEGGWFQARWHFSFDRYYDPENMGFGRHLRVFNDDRLVPGAVWPMHPHRDIEGITYVVEGEFEHADSLGEDGVLPAGSVQRMTLGSGAEHSERNHCSDIPMRFLQMWILPAERGLPPSVEQRVFTEEDRTDRLLEVVGPKAGGAGGPVQVHQDARVFVSRMSPGTSLQRDLPEGFGWYLYCIEGDIGLNGEKLGTGDAAKIEGEREIRLEAAATSELIAVEVLV